MHICTSFAPLCLIHCVRVCVCVALHLADSIGELEAKVVAALVVVVAVVYCFNFSFARSPPNISPKRKKEKNKWVQVEEGKERRERKEFLEQFSFTFSAYFCTTCKLRHFVSVSVFVSALYMPYLYLYPRPCVVRV